MIMVLGSKGLLGSAVCRVGRNDVIGFSREVFDIRKEPIKRLLDNAIPDVVINCIGITDKSASVREMRLVNEHFPQQLAVECDRRSIRLIHISTDCVFDGRRGGYREDDQTSAEDWYGITKASGEVAYSNHLTIRTSFVGLPDRHQRGLLAWQQLHAGKPIVGYSAAWWNGLCVDTLADFILKNAYNPRMTGLRHVFGETVSKYQLLSMANEIFGWQCSITPSATKGINRTLDTLYDKYDFAPLRVQLMAMKNRIDQDNQEFQPFRDPSSTTKDRPSHDTD